MPAHKKPEEEKAVSVNVSLPSWMWQQVKSHADAIGTPNASEAVRDLLLRAGIKKPKK